MEKLLAVLTSTPVLVIAYAILFGAFIYLLTKDEREWLREFIKARRNGSEAPIADANAAIEAKENDTRVEESDIIKSIYYVPGVLAIIIPRNAKTGKIVWNYSQGKDDEYL